MASNERGQWNKGRGFQRQKQDQTTAETFHEKDPFNPFERLGRCAFESLVVTIFDWVVEVCVAVIDGGWNENNSFFEKQKCLHLEQCRGRNEDGVTLILLLECFFIETRTRNIQSGWTVSHKKSKLRTNLMRRFLLHWQLLKIIQNKCRKTLFI